MADDDLVRLIRELIKQEMSKHSRLGTNELTSKTGDLNITAMGHIFIDPPTGKKGYYKGVEIGTGAGGGITGSGTANYLAKFTGASAIGDSNLIDDGTDLGSAVNIILKSAKQLKLNNVSNTLVGKVFGTSATVEAITYNGLQLQPQNTIGTTPGNIYIGDYNAAPSGRGIKITDSGIDIYPTGIEKSFFHHTELANFRLENLATGSLPDGGIGGLAYDTTVNEPKVNKGTVGTPNWVTLGGAYLPLAGGTLIGQLYIQYSNPRLAIVEPSTGLPDIIISRNGSTRGIIAVNSSNNFTMEATYENIRLVPSATDKYVEIAANNTTSSVESLRLTRPSGYPGRMISFLRGTTPQGRISFDGLDNLIILSEVAGSYIKLSPYTVTYNSGDFLPFGGGAFNLGNASDYWLDVSYKTLTDRGCLGSFDNGVELLDGRKVSDIDALLNIKTHPIKTTIYGTPRFDYKTMPKAVYKVAEIDGKILPRDNEDRPYHDIKVDGNTERHYAEDGAEMTALISIMIGGIKELHNRLTKLETTADLVGS